MEGWKAFFQRSGPPRNAQRRSSRILGLEFWVLKMTAGWNHEIQAEPDDQQSYNELPYKGTIGIIILYFLGALKQIVGYVRTCS